jgi:hypothetical protein
MAGFASHCPIASSKQRLMWFQGQQISILQPPKLPNFGFSRRPQSVDLMRHPGIWNNITLWLFNIAMGNGPFIDGLPIKNGI